MKYLRSERGSGVPVPSYLRLCVLKLGIVCRSRKVLRLLTEKKCVGCCLFVVVVVDCGMERNERGVERY